MYILSGFIIIQGIPFLMFSAFVCIFVGFLFGRITIKGINLGSSGVFIIALLYGAIFSSQIKSTISQKSNGKNIDISASGLKILENIGLILFIGSVGFISGPTFFKNMKKNFKSYLIVGLFVVLISTLLCVIIFYIGKKSAKDPNEFSAMMVGIFAGALTSTPAFSAAKASAMDEYESAVTVGYGIAYIFGVLGVVIFVQLVPKIGDVDMDIERELILDKEYKIAKRVGTDRSDKTEQTQQTERIKISTMTSTKSLPDKSQKINIMKSEKNSNINYEKEIKLNKNISHKSKFSSGISVESEANEQKAHNIIFPDEEEKKNKDKEEEININKRIKSSINSEIVNEKENENNQEENEDNQKEEKDNKEELFVIDKNGFCAFGFAAIIGIFVGAIRIPLSKEVFDGSCFSLTTTGGVLLISIIIGHIGKIKKLSLKVEKKLLENFRELGLILFLLGTGISGGTKFIDYFKAIYFVYGIIITLVPLIIGFLFNKFVLKLCLLNNLGALTGAMTSTPALGTLINVAKTDQVGNAYAATYPFSLISVVLAAQFMVLLMK